MRRALALYLALILLAASGLAYAHSLVNASRDTVEMRETVLCGDSAQANGIRVRVPVYAGNHLFWDTELETGTDGAVKTDFRFSAQREYINREHEPGGLNVNLMTNMGASGNFGAEFDFESMYYGGYNDDFYRIYGAALSGVASRTGPGLEHTEYVELSDWIDYVPLRFDLDLPGYVYQYDGGETYVEASRGNTEMIGQLLAEYFRIPLTGPCPTEITVSRNTDGEIVDLQINAVYEHEDEPKDTVYEDEDGNVNSSAAVPAGTWEGLNVTSFSVVTDDACYFALEQWEQDRELGRVDFSSLPGGRGVYRLPFEYEGEASGVTHVYLDDIEPVMPVADGEYVELLDTDGERMLLFTVGNGKLYLTQAALPDLTDVKKTVLTDLKELEGGGHDGYNRMSKADGLYCVETIGGRVLLLERVNGGEYELVLNAPDDFAGADESAEELLWAHNVRLSYDNYNAALLWDGSRLVVARWCGNDNSGFYGEVTGPALWIYDETGLIYCGIYDSSLSRSPTEEYGNCIRSSGDLELSWKQGVR